MRNKIKMDCFAGIVELEEETPLVKNDAFEGVSLSDLSLGECHNLACMTLLYLKIKNVSNTHSFILLQLSCAHMKPQNLHSIVYITLLENQGLQVRSQASPVCRMRQ